MKRRLLPLLIRIVVSGLLIAFLLTSVDLSELGGALKSANIWYLLIALLLVFLRLLVMAYRWQIMLLPKGIRVPLLSLTAIYFVGRFFSMFLPTVIGGDIVRGYELSRLSSRAADSAATVVMERLIGFAAAFIICWISMIFGFRYLEGTNTIIIIGALSFAFILLLAAAFNATLMTKIVSLGRVLKRWNVEGKLMKAYRSLHAFTASKDILVKGLLVSFIHQLIGVAVSFFVSQSLGLNVSFVYFLIAIPIIWIIMMIPVSIAGLGVREGAFVLFFTQYGVSSENALLLSLLVFGLTLISALLGGIIYSWGGYRKRAYHNEVK